MGSCQITKTGINLDIIMIIQVYLEIYDLWKDVLVGGLMGGVMSNH